MNLPLIWTQHSFILLLFECLSETYLWLNIVAPILCRYSSAEKKRYKFELKKIKKGIEVIEQDLAVSYHDHGIRSTILISQAIQPMVIEINSL